MSCVLFNKHGKFVIVVSVQGLACNTVRGYWNSHAGTAMNSNGAESWA